MGIWGTPREYLWGALSLIIAILVAIGLMLFAKSEPASVPPLAASEYDEQLNYLDRVAIEAAYSAQVQKLFAVWMVDYRSKGQPEAMLKGHRNARKGFIEAMKAIEQRQ